MADEYDIYNELEAERIIDSRQPEEPDQPEPYKMGVGSYVLILFAHFVDIIEMVAAYTGVGLVIAIPLGLAVDVAIFLGVGTSKKARQQWKRFALGFIAENFPVLASLLEFIPFRTFALIWMYRGMSAQKPEDFEEAK